MLDQTDKSASLLAGIEIPALTVLSKNSVENPQKSSMDSSDTPSVDEFAALLSVRGKLVGAPPLVGGESQLQTISRSEKALDELRDAEKKSDQPGGTSEVATQADLATGQKRTAENRTALTVATHSPTFRSQPLSDLENAFDVHTGHQADPEHGQRRDVDQRPGLDELSEVLPDPSNSQSALKSRPVKSDIVLHLENSEAVVNSQPDLVQSSGLTELSRSAAQQEAMAVPEPQIPEDASLATSRSGKTATPALAADHVRSTLPAETPSKSAYDLFGEKQEAMLAIFSGNKSGESRAASQAGEGQTEIIMQSRAEKPPHGPIPEQTQPMAKASGSLSTSAGNAIELRLERRVATHSQVTAVKPDNVFLMSAAPVRDQSLFADAPQRVSGVVDVPQPVIEPGGPPANKGALQSGSSTLPFRGAPDHAAAALFDPEVPTSTSHPEMESLSRERGDHAIRAHSSLSARVDAETSRGVIAQVRDIILSSKERLTEVRLSPEELGRVRFTFSAGESPQLVSVQVERADTLDLIRRNLDLLRTELEDAGCGMAETDFLGTFDSQSEHEFHAEEFFICSEQGLQDAEPTAENRSRSVFRASMQGRLDLRL